MPHIRSHIRFYFAEGLCLAGFVVIAALSTIFFEHPEQPVMKSEWKDLHLLRRVPVGLILGVYIFFVTKAYGHTSGAHINPAVTWTFYRLGKISFADAVWYTFFQFAGAIAAALLLKTILGHWFAHPTINYSVTAPKPPHSSIDAFIGEFIISFILMLVILLFTTLKKLEHYVAPAAGVLITLFIVFEHPFSGMSINPARSTAGAVAAGQYNHLWIYFVAPVTAMLMAAEVFIRLQRRRSSTFKKGLPILPSNG